MCYSHNWPSFLFNAFAELMELISELHNTTYLMIIVHQRLQFCKIKKIGFQNNVFGTIIEKKVSNNYIIATALKGEVFSGHLPLNSLIFTLTEA